MNIKSKKELRKWAKELRKTLDFKKLSTCIEHKLKELGPYKDAKIVMSYMAKDFEVSLNNLFLDKSKNWFLPLVKNDPESQRIGETENQQKDCIVAVPYIPEKTKLEKNQFGILEPALSRNEIHKTRLIKLSFDLIFVPGLCFDKFGNRIGYGAGFYDNFLKLNSESIKIGVCPKECFVDILPCDEWDQRVDMVITDEL